MSMKKKHKKLQGICIKTKKNKPKLSTWLQKKITEEEKAKKETEEGARLWKEWWIENRLEPNPEFQPEMLFKINGKPPPIPQHSDSEGEDDHYE